jgi:hypothetical protein
VRLEDSATELQQPSNQSYSYIEANTELDEEIAALQQSWHEHDMEYRQQECSRLCADDAKLVKDYKRELESLRESLEERELKQLCGRELEKLGERFAESGQPTFDWKSLPKVVFAYGGYMVGRVRAFLNFFP